jgi:hypothetical protein
LISFFEGKIMNQQYMDSVKQFLMVLDIKVAEIPSMPRIYRQTDSVRFKLDTPGEAVKDSLDACYGLGQEINRNCWRWMAPLGEVRLERIDGFAVWGLVFDPIPLELIRNNQLDMELKRAGLPNEVRYQLYLAMDKLAISQRPASEMQPGDTPGLLDQFAMTALQGLMANSHWRPSPNADAEMAYAAALSMLEERARVINRMADVNK